jgi:CBS domain-containing protein/hemerythrin-like domain-containing protein
VLGALSAVAARVESGDSAPASLHEAAVDFIGAFVDRCHHAKEELIFDVLEGRHDAVSSALLADLRAHHVDARRRLEELRAPAIAGDPAFAERVREYVRLLRLHLAREETELFPRLEEVLGPADLARIEQAWDELETRVAGPAARAALVELADTVASVGDMRPGTPLPRPASAAAVMRPDVPAVAPQDSLARVADIMGRLAIRELPVVENGQLVGIITRRDMEPHLGHFEWTTVATAMTPDPVTVPPDADAAVAASVLLSRAFNAVPVAVGTTLLGMLGRADLLRLLAAR